MAKSRDGGVVSEAFGRHHLPSSPAVGVELSRVSLADIALTRGADQGVCTSQRIDCPQVGRLSSARFLCATSDASALYRFDMASHQAFRRRVSEDSISLRADRSKASLDAFRNRSLFQFSVLANSGTESLAGLNGERDPRALSLSKGQHEPSPVS